MDSSEKELLTQKPLQKNQTTQEHENEELLRTSFDLAPVGMALVSLQGQWLKVNQALCKILGYSTNELLQRDFHENVHAEDLDQNLSYAYELLTSGQPVLQFEKRFHHKLGNVIWVAISLCLARNQIGEPTYFILHIQEISERKKLEEKLLYQASHDILTGLPNRILLMDRLQQAIIQARRTKVRIAVISFNIDRFKLINDSFGHITGDKLLQAIASKMINCTRESDTVARLGNDKFVVLANNLPKELDSLVVAQKILSTFNENFIINDHEIKITTSIGISLYPNDAEDVNTLLKSTELALLSAKNLGQNKIYFANNQLQQYAEKLLLLKDDLHKAIENKELALYFQPIIDAKNGTITSLETLLRWRHPQRGLVPAKEFMQLAEESGLMIPIGNWILRTACKQNKAWQDEGLPPITIAVNLSISQFRQPNLAKIVKDILTEAQLDPRYLELEISADIINEHNDKTTTTLTELGLVGCRITIDNFGQGDIDLNYIKCLPISKLKIAKTFLENLENSTENIAIVQAIAAIANSFKLCLCAKGIESIAQLHFIKSYLHDEIQGDYFSRPLSMDECAKLLRENIKFNFS